MANLMKMFTVMIIVQLFYSFGITTLTHSLPTSRLDYVEGFSDLADRLDLQTISNTFEDSVLDSMNMPLIELGALIFYSGNIIIDLLMNFIFAIPQMIGLFINGFIMLFSIDTFFTVQVQLFTSVIIGVMYFIGLLQLLMNVRSQGAIL